MAHNEMLVTVVSCAWSTMSIGLYIRSIFQGVSKPHLFSWLIWAILDFVVAVAQVAGHAGVGAWATVWLGLLCLAVSLLSLKYGSKSRTRSDWTMLILSLAAIPLWVITKEPLSAVVLLTAINCTGYIPTFRKSYHAPHEEKVLCWALGVISGIFLIGSLETYNLTTVLFPVSILLPNAILSLMILARRRVVAAV